MKIVLTAPATEMSEYNGNPAIAFVAGFSKPFFISRRHLLAKLYRPSPEDGDLRVAYAPLGLRRIEASLVASGMFRRDDVAIVHPDRLEEVVSGNTKVVAVGVKDPLGLGYVSLTYTTLLGLGESINKFEFVRLMKTIKKLKKRYRFRVVVGGPGVWQFRLFDHDIIDRLGIDVVIDGEGEIVVPDVLSRLIKGDSVDRFVNGGIVPVDSIPCILGASVYGAVEISRGCGRGCMFCTPTMRLRRDIPLEKVLRDIEVNLSHGQDKVLLVTEDLFLYGARVPWEPNGDAIIKLVDSITQLKSKGLRYVQITHMNLAAVRYRKDVFKAIADRLYEFAWYKHKNSYINTVEVGIESGSPRVIAKLMRGKVLPYTPEEWPETIIDSFITMEDCGWIPLATIIVGLPGEEVNDALKTLELLDNIRSHGLKTFLCPLIFVPLGGSALEDQPIRSFSELSDIQLSIFSECWKHNIREWGADHLRNYGFMERAFLKILAKVYLATVARKYRWRKVLAMEIYKELKKLLSRGVPDSPEPEHR